MGDGVTLYLDGFFGRGTKPTSTEVKDLLALGLVGGGMKDVDADRVIANCSPADLMRIYQIAQAVLGVAFMPEVGEATDVKKKPKQSQAKTSTSEG